MFCYQCEKRVFKQKSKNLGSNPNIFKSFFDRNDSDFGIKAVMLAEKVLIFWFYFFLRLASGGRLPGLFTFCGVS